MISHRYVVVRARLTSSSCWSINATGQIVLETGVAIVAPLPPLPEPVARNVVRGVFGGQFLLADGFGQPGPTAAVLIGMRSIRTTGAVWKQVQPNPGCWDRNNATCFNWGHYDDAYFSIADAGLEIMLCALEMAPRWAALANFSSTSWSRVPGPDHYRDYEKYLTILFNRCVVTIDFLFFKVLSCCNIALIANDNYAESETGHVNIAL